MSNKRNRFEKLNKEYSYHFGITVKNFINITLTASGADYYLNLSVMAIDFRHVFRALNFAQRLINNLDALVQFTLADHQGRGEANDRLVGRLGQQTVLLQRYAHVPGSARVFGVHLNRAEQATTAHRLDEREFFLELAQHAQQLVAHQFSALDQLLLLDHFQGCNAHSRS